MFIGASFYNEHIRKAVVAFGALFDGVTINRKDDAGATLQSLRVPLSYGPKQKYIARAAETPSFDEGKTFASILPRMAFEITSVKYDATRQLQSSQKLVNRLPEGGAASAFVSAPYNMGVALSVLAKNQEDGLQIVEQILPYFTPDFNVTIQEMPQLGVSRDLQFILNGVDFTEDYEGNFTERNVITWDLDFTIKMNLYGKVADTKRIKKVIANIYAGPKGLDTPEGERVTVTPDPIDADPLSDYGFITTIDELEGHNGNV